MATSSHVPLVLNDEEQLIYERLTDCFDEERKRVAMASSPAMANCVSCGCYKKLTWGRVPHRSARRLFALLSESATQVRISNTSK